jgi:hypothetical protein
MLVVRLNTILVLFTADVTLVRLNTIPVLFTEGKHEAEGAVAQALACSHRHLVPPPQRWAMPACNVCLENKTTLLQ